MGRVVERRITMSPTLEAVRAECLSRGRGFGNRLSEIVERYLALVERYSPRRDFRPAEWEVLCCVLHERWPRPDTAPTPEHVGEVLRQAGQPDLAKWVEGLEVVETTALLEEIWRDEQA